MVRKEGDTLIGVGMVRELGGWIEGAGGVREVEGGECMVDEEKGVRKGRIKGRGMAWRERGP
jgi:hypothetical protein